MYLSIENVKEENNFERNFEFDYSNNETNEVLLKKVSKVKGNLSAFLIANDEINVTVSGTYNAVYLDARTLTPLDVEFQFDENLMFTNQLNKAEELDIDYLQDEIEIKDLVWELILMSCPFNYSEEKNDQILTEEQMDQTFPFADLFKEKE